MTGVQTCALPISVGGGPFDPLLAADVERFLAEAMEAARREVRLLNGAIGRNVADTMVKHAAKQRLDAVVHPLAHLARAWSGAAMLGQRDCNDEYLALAKEVAATRQWPEHLTNNQQNFSRAGHLSLPWDIVFPEVFGGGEHAGFDVVLGNPPWETIQYSTKDFLADQDLGRAAEAASDGTVRQEFDAYKQAFEQQKRLYGRLYHYQKITISGKRATAGNLDTFRLFAERSFDLAGPAGTIGMVLPSAFHANEGATAIRRRYLNETRLDLCLSFENRKKLFDIDSRFRFNLIVARRPGPTRALNCAFYLDGFDRIDDPTCRMIYDADFISRSGGGYDTLLELRTETDLAVARTMFCAASDLRQWCAETGLRFGRDLHMTDDADKFVPMDNISPGSLLTLHEGKTFHQFTDRWNTAPRYGVAPDALTAKPTVAAAAGFWRLAFRDIASATNERTMIAAVLPPGVVCSHTVTIERRPWERSNADMLTLCAILNTYAFDWLTRLKAGSHLSLYIVEGLPMPALTPEVRKFLAHAALRLSCNHRGYEGLWREQLNGSAQPVFVSDKLERWRVRADVDAVVAAGYGLDRSAYRRILCGFNHRSFVGAPELCLNAFDAITRDGLDRFCVEQDIYATVALPSATL